MKIATALCAVALLGCAAKTGLNVPCTLTRSTDAGSETLTEFEAQNRLKGPTSVRVLITMHSTQCEEGFCFRDSSVLNGNDPDAPAAGYCSGLCTMQSSCASDDPALDARTETKLSCQHLLLDKTTLDALDIGAIEPNFCTRNLGAAADGGV